MNFPKHCPVTTYDDCSTFAGRTTNNMREHSEEKGVYRYANGDVYDGLWKAGKRHGRGKMTYKNGDYYDGEWLDGNWHGQGLYRDYNRMRQYEGGFQDGKLHAEKGKCTWEHQGVEHGTFEGKFEKGMSVDVG